MIRKYAEIFCWKNVSSFCIAKATHIFSAKNIIILYIESTKTVNEMTLNELVKLTTLWTTGPSLAVWQKLTNYWCVYHWWIVGKKLDWFFLCQEHAKIYLTYSSRNMYGAFFNRKIYGKCPKIWNTLYLYYFIFFWPKLCFLCSFFFAVFFFFIYLVEWQTV